MNSRKVHDVKGSYIVYLPKNWALKCGIDKNREIDLEELADGSLILLPTSSKNVEKKPFTFMINLNNSNIPVKWEYITNLVIGGYVIGVDQIIILDKNGLTTSKREEVSNLLRNLFGFEIHEETSDTIRIVSIGETSESTRVLLQRTFSILKLMFEATKDIINNPNDNEITAIIRRDDDVDRFRLLIERQTHRFLSNPTSAIKVGLSLIEALHISQIAKFTERLADHITLFVEKLRNMPNDFKKDSLINAIEETEKIFNITVDLVSTKELERGFQVLARRKELLNEWMQQKFISKQVSYMNSLFSHLERILDYSTDIIEVIIDSDIYADIEEAL